MLPTVLRDINAFLGDKSYAGICNKIVPPKINIKTVDLTLAGFAGDVERSLGKLEKLECAVEVSDYSTAFLDYVGNSESQDEKFVVKFALDRDGVVVGGVMRIAGLWKETEFNDFAPSTEAMLKFNVAVLVFEVEIDGKEVIYIDKELNIFRINGVDRNKTLREALSQ